MKITATTPKPVVTIELTAHEAQHLFSVLNWTGVLHNGTHSDRITEESQQVSTEIWNELHNLGFEVIRPK